MQAKLVYDGGDQVYIPEEMGTPRADQMQGTVGEQLTELAGRVCYDSLGRGRPSFAVTSLISDGVTPNLNADILPRTTVSVEGYHDHIRSSNNGSVLEHYPITFQLGTFADVPIDFVAVLLCGRPGVHVRFISDPISNLVTDCRITFNLRAAREWERWSNENLTHERHLKEARELGSIVATYGHELAPHIIDDPKIDGFPSWVADLERVSPLTDDEKWVSLYMSGSRGFSHELVRHKYRTAVSQRSTRYVDESESDWIEHPLIQEFVRQESEIHKENPIMMDILNSENAVIDMARRQYTACVKVLEKWLLCRGVDKSSARKQARGAARGYLGNALQTELIFSASISQWKHMLGLRANALADAEIREIFCQALGELKRSRYGDCFAGYELRPSPDGIGQIAVFDPPL